MLLRHSKNFAPAPNPLNPRGLGTHHRLLRSLSIFTQVAAHQFTAGMLATRAGSEGAGTGSPRPLFWAAYLFTTSGERIAVPATLSSSWTTTLGSATTFTAYVTAGLPLAKTTSRRP